MRTITRLCRCQAAESRTRRGQALLPARRISRAFACAGVCRSLHRQIPGRFPYRLLCTGALIIDETRQKYISIPESSLEKRGDALDVKPRVGLICVAVYV